MKYTSQEIRDVANLLRGGYDMGDCGRNVLRSAADKAANMLDDFYEEVKKKEEFCVFVDSL